MDLHCVIFHIFLLKLLFAEKRPLSVQNFTSVISKMNSPPSLSSSNYFSHSAWISWSLHSRMHVSFLLHPAILFLPVEETQLLAGLDWCLNSFAFLFVFPCVCIKISMYLCETPITYHEVMVFKWS